METVHLTNATIEEAVAKAAAVLSRGGVILYPTDTVYGLGADAFSDGAVAKVYAIKSRDEKKPIHCVVADMAMAQRLAEVNDLARTLAERLLPGPLTLVLKKNPAFDTGIAKGMGTIGIRIPKDDLCLALAKKFGPYTTTSANAAGKESLSEVAAILEQLGERSSEIDLIIDAGELPKREPSTVVDVSSGKAVVLREGAISSENVLLAAGS